MKRHNKRANRVMQESKSVTLNHHEPRNISDERAEKSRRALIHACTAASAVALLSILTATPSYALPQNGSTVGGAATISQPNATSITINQNSANAIINWQGYNIGANESVTYIQPNSSSIILNRVTGVDPSRIYGLLSGNGQVWVINPNGLLVGSGANVQTSGFLASTMNITNENFMSGKYLFTNTPDSLASVVNEGSILAADGGYVVLAAPSVTNSGSIVANVGSVHLASGDAITLSIGNSNLINVAVSGDVSAQALGVTNSGRISADGGQVVLTARVAGDVMKNIVNNEGIIEAKSIIEKDGIIILDGGDHGITANSGTLDASGRNPGEVGGTVKMLGDKVGLFAGSTVDVSGDAGGGAVLIGGNFHGEGPEKNSSMTYVDKDAVIKADARATGDGGRVVVWSDDATRFYGSISAKGGVLEGDGGNVEVSGKHSLTYAGLTNLGASNGKTGTLLLDPDEITITHGSADTNISVTGTGPFTDTSSGSGSILSDGTINTQLGTANVTITTSAENITSQADVAIALNSNTLTLQSASGITLGGTYSGAGTLNLNFTTNLDLRTNTYNVSGVTAVNASGGGTGTILGPNQATAFGITGENTGSLSSSSGLLTFTGINNLAGGSAADTFTLGAGVSTFNGVITGGGGANTLVVTDGDNAWKSTGTNNGALNTTTAFTGITTLTGGTGIDTLAGQNAANTWNITNANAVTVDGMNATGMNALAGGSAADTFTLSAGISTFNGSIAGGGGTDTLVATNGANTWRSSGTKSGALNTTTTFTGITNLTGGSGSDTLTGQNAANIWSITSANAVTLDSMNTTGMEALAGGTLADTFTLGTGIPTFNGSITGGGGTDTLVATSGVNRWQITGASNGALNTTTTFSGFTFLTGGSGADTLTGSGQTYTLDDATANKGSNGTLRWTSMENLTDTGAGIFKFGSAGSVTGDITASGGTLDYAGHTSAVSINLIGTPALTTGIGGSWNGITTVTGSSNLDTITSTGATYNLTAANAGNSGGVSWTSVENIHDTALTPVSVFKFAPGGSVTGSLTATGGTLDYSAYNSAVTFSLGGTATGVTGGWSGITNVLGSSGNTDTVSGTGKTYNLTGANAGNSSGISWSLFEKIADTGTGTIATALGQTYNLTGINTGSITTLLPGGYTGISNLRDSGAATFNMHNTTDGSVTGTISAVGGTLNYSGYGSAVTFGLDGTATGSGNWVGFTSVIGSSSSNDTVSGTNKTYNLSGANAGNSGTVFWTLFEKIADTGIGTIATTGGKTYTLTGVNSGNIDTLLPGGYSGIGNLTDSGAGRFQFTSNGALSGIITATGGTLDYSTWLAGPITVNLSSKTAHGIVVPWSGITSIIGSGAADTIYGANATYNLTAANSGNSGLVSWTAFEKIADTGTGTIATSAGQTYNLTGANSGNVDTLLSGGYTGIGNLTDSGAGKFRFAAGGAVTGNLTANGGTLDYSAGVSGAVAVNLTAKTGTGIGGVWNGITTMTGSGVTDTINSTGATYNLTAADTGNSGGVSWTSFENLHDTAAGTFKFAAGGAVTGGLSATGGTLDYSAGITGPIAVNLTAKTGTGIGSTWNGITTVTGSAAADTMGGANATYTLTAVNAGNSGGVLWSSFENIADTGTGTLVTTGGQTYNLTGANTGNVATLLPGSYSGIGSLTDSDAGRFRFAAGGALTGSITATGGTLDYSAGITGPVAVNLTAKTGTGIAGNWNGITTVTGSAAADTITSTGATYNMTAADAGNSSGVSWSSFENLHDTAAGIFKFGAGGSITGTIFGVNGTLDYSAGITGPVAVNLTAKTGTGIGGAWNGITTITGSGAADTMGGDNAIYNLTATNSGTGNGVSWSSFEKIADTGIGTIATSGGQTYNLTGSNAGNVATLLPGGFTGIGNLSDSGAGKFRFAAGGAATGDLTAVDGTLDYSAGITGPVSVNLTAKTGTGIDGAWSGIATIIGSGAADTMGGNNATYNLTAVNSGNGDGVSWSSFEKIADTGIGTIATIGGQTYNLTGTNAGNVTTLLPGGYTGIGNLTDLGAAKFKFGATGSVTGNISGTDGTLDYSAGIAAPVSIDLTLKTGTGIGGNWSGITTVTGSAAVDTIGGTNATYNLTAANAGNSDGVLWSSFETISDTGVGTIATTAGQTYTLTGTNAGNVATLLPGGYTGIGSLTDSGAATFRVASNGAVTGGLTATNGTLDYSAGITGPVAVDLTAKTGTGIGGAWSGIATIIGSSAADTVTSTGATYNLTAPDAGNSSGVSWTSFENLRDSATGIFKFNLDGAVSGGITAIGGTLDYSAGITGPVAVDLTAKTGTGIGGTWDGITTVTGSAASDTISGSSQTFNLTGANAGHNGVVSWTSFENINGLAGTNAYIESGGSLSGAIADSGTGATLQGAIQTGDAQSYSGAVILGAGTTLTSTNSGNITFAGTVDSDSTARDLTITTSGVTTFGGAVGTTALKSLTINAGGATSINGGSVTTSGAAGQVYNNDIILGGDTTLNAGSGAILLGSTGSITSAGLLTTKSGSGQALVGSGANTIAAFNATNSSSGDIILSNNASTLNITGINQAGGQLLITSSGAITSSGPLTVTGATTITAAGQPVTLTDANNDFTGSVTVTGTATQITDRNNLAVVLNTTGPTTLIAGADLNISGISTDSVSATAVNKITLSNPRALLLTLTGDTIVGTMSNPSPLDLTTTTDRAGISVNLTGGLPFLTLVGDIRKNIRGIGLYNGEAIAGDALDYYKSAIDFNASTVASDVTTQKMEDLILQANHNDFFKGVSKEALIDFKDAFYAPEADPELIDR